MSKNQEIENIRIQKFDVAVEAAASLLGGIRVIRALGAQPGRYVDALASLYLPNAKQAKYKGQTVTKLVTPKKYTNNTSIPLVMVNSGEFLLPSRDMMTQHKDQMDVFKKFTEKNVRPDEVDSVISDVELLFDEGIKATEPFSLRMTESGDEGRPKTIATSVKAVIGSVPYSVKARPATYLPITETLTRESVGRMLLHSLGHTVNILHNDPRPFVQDDPWPKIEEGQILKIDKDIALASLPYRMRQT